MTPPPSKSRAANGAKATANVPASTEPAAHAPGERIRVLLVEDEEVDCLAFTRAVQREQLPYDFQIARTLGEARHALTSGKFDVVLVDQVLPDGVGFDLFDVVDAASVVLFVTRADDVDLALRAIRRGAADYLVKDRERMYLKLLPASVARALAFQSAQRNARRNVQLLYEVFDGSPIGKALLARDGRFLRVNRAFCDLCGFPAAELLEQNVQLIAPVDEHGRPTEDFLGLLRGMVHACQWERPGRHRSGRSWWMQIDASLIAAEADESAAIIWQVQDVTARRQAAAALQASEEKYRALARHFPNGAVFLFDHDLRYLLAEGTGLAAAGLSQQGLEGRTIWEVLPAEVCREIEPAYRAALAGQSSANEVVVGEFTYAVNYAPVRDAAGRVVTGMAMAQDITDRKRAEAALRESERQLRVAQAVGRLGSYVFSTATGSWTSSSLLDEIFGLPADFTYDVAGWLCIVHPAERADMQRYFLEEVLGARRTFDREYRIVRLNDAQERWVHGRGELTVDDAGRVVQMIGTIQDITARKRAEDELRHNEERFRHLLASVTDYTYSIRFEAGRPAATTHSPGSITVTGYAPEEYVARPYLWYEMVDPADREAVLHHAAAALRGEIVKPLEHRIRHKTGGLRWVRNTLAPRRDSSGQLVACDGLIENITERKLVEEALRESDERFRTLTAAAFEGIGISERGVVIDANDQLLAMLGYSRVEMIGRPVADFIAAESRASVAARLNSGDEQAYEHRMRRKDGTTVEVEARARMLRIGERQLRLTALRDLTERKRAEEQKLEFERRLQDTQRLEALGTLAGGVAHDFNNILAAIFGNVALARMEMTDDHPAQPVLSEIGHLSERARDLVRQILTFSRPQSGQRASVRLDELVREAAKMLRATISTTVQLDVDIAANTPPVLADATQIHQVLVNLGTNAWQAIGGQAGRITLRLLGVTVDAAQAAADPRLREGSFAVLSVMDTGRGMDAETIKHVFDPFFTTKGPGQGTGLGLAVVHGIVKAHGGFVTVRSAPGQGALFQVYLPATAESASPVSGGDAPGPTIARPANTKCIRILFVDDEPPVAKICSLLLRRAGYEVATHTDPDEALAVFRREPARFDLVLTDMSMPGMNGVDFSLAVHRVRPDIPIILSTGFTASLTAESARELGISALINKPVGPDDLVGTVRRVLETGASGG